MLKEGKSKKVIGYNINELEASGLEPRRALAAALRKAGVKKKKKVKK